MTSISNQKCINFLYRKLGIPRELVYLSFRKFNYFFPSKKHIDNEITVNEIADSTKCMPEQSAYKKFNLADLNLSEQVVSDCLNIFTKNRNRYNEEYFLKNPKKRFLLTIDSDESLLKNENIFKFVTSENVQSIVSTYLQFPYVLSTIRLWWTPTNNTMVSSQKFHLDDEDLMQVKLFLNITEVTSDHGPFTFLPANLSKIVLNSYSRHKRRYTDEEVYKALGKPEQVQLTGRAGDGAFIDTSRCLHYGSRNNRKERLVLMAQFLKSNSPILKNSISINSITR